MHGRANKLWTWYYMQSLTYNHFRCVTGPSSHCRKCLAYNNRSVSTLTPIDSAGFFPEACVANTFLQGMQNVWHDQDFRLNLGIFGASAQWAHILAFLLVIMTSYLLNSKGCQYTRPLQLPAVIARARTTTTNQGPPYSGEVHDITNLRSKLWRILRGHHRVDTCSTWVSMSRNSATSRIAALSVDTKLRTSVCEND